MPVRLVVEDGPHEGVSPVDVKRRAVAMLKATRMGDAELSLVLTGDASIQELNRTYRNKDTPTDVLAFAQREGPLGKQAGNLLGDVIVSVPTARRQARAHRRSLVAELTMLMAHGVLHLLGWDHDTESRDRLMRRETARLCKAAEAATLGGPHRTVHAAAAADRARAPARPRKSRRG
jgi:probable rRNA maturation factor